MGTGLPFVRGAARGRSWRLGAVGAIPDRPGLPDQHGRGGGAILVAVLFGVIFSNLNPTKVTVGFATPSPSPSGSIVLGPSFSAGPSVPAVVSATPVPTPALPGAITFGTVLDGATRTVSQPTDQFTPQAGAFAHSIAFAAPYGASVLVEEVARVAGDGSETIVQSRDEGGNNADPNHRHRLQRARFGRLQAWGTATS